MRGILPAPGDKEHGISGQKKRSNPPHSILFHFFFLSFYGGDFVLLFVCLFGWLVVVLFVVVLFVVFAVVILVFVVGVMLCYFCRAEERLCTCQASNLLKRPLSDIPRIFFFFFLVFEALWLSYNTPWLIYNALS